MIINLEKLDLTIQSVCSYAVVPLSKAPNMLKWPTAMDTSPKQILICICEEHLGSQVKENLKTVA